MAAQAVRNESDLSALFVLRAVERYLKGKGRFGFVMPWSALRGRQFAGFRSGHYTKAAVAIVNGRLRRRSWDLHAIKPTFFPVPCGVVLGQQSDSAVPLGASVEAWSGRLPKAKHQLGFRKNTFYAGHQGLLAEQRPYVVMLVALLTPHASLKGRLLFRGCYLSSRREGTSPLGAGLAGVR